jgi:hypothetical protein
MFPPQDAVHLEGYEALMAVRDQVEGLRPEGQTAPRVFAALAVIVGRALVSDQRYTQRVQLGSCYADVGSQLSVATVSGARTRSGKSHSPPPVPMSNIVVALVARSTTISSNAHGGGSETSLVPSLVKSQP